MVHSILPIISVARCKRSNKREYGRAALAETIHDDLFHGIATDSQVWMSHADTIAQLPEGFEILARTESIPVAAFRSTGQYSYPVYCLQFHPEVTHSVDGKAILYNFIVNIAGVEQSWTPRFICRRNCREAQAANR